MIGFDLAAHGGAVVVRFAVHVLVAGAFADWVHVFHPEMIEVRAECAHGLPERGFDLEAQGVEAEHVERVHGEQR